jgi:hypothetical protein
MIIFFICGIMLPINYEKQNEALPARANKRSTAG